MINKKFCAAAAAAISIAAYGVGPAAASTVPVSIQITEDFCGPGTTCGTARGSLGAGTEQTVIEDFTPIGGGCFHDVHTTTATFTSGTLTFTVDGTLCAAPTPGNFTLTGSWTVTGGTGSFSNAHGGGTARAFRQNGPIHATAIGALN